MGGVALGEVDIMELLLGVVGREELRLICKGLVAIVVPGAERGGEIVGIPFEDEGDRPRREEDGGARDINHCDGRRCKAILLSSPNQHANAAARQ